jgi:heptaprenylglyceryl phosphate synthase
MVREPILKRLRASRPSLLHAIDPFKIEFTEALDKAHALWHLGFPALLLASTDWHNFESTVGPLVAAIKEQLPSFPVLLHFPPQVGAGLPMVASADSVLYPFLLRSTDPYFVWRSYAETVSHWTVAAMTEGPEMIDLAALTFGADERSSAVLGVEPTVPSAAEADVLVKLIDLMGLHGAYLYSRCESVPLDVCRQFRDCLHADQVLFLSGGVRCPEQANAFFDAGADFVVFCGALESGDWRHTLDNLITGSFVAGTRSAAGAHGRRTAPQA